MSGISRILMFMVSCVFTENVIFARLLGDEALGEEHRLGVAAGYGLATAAAMAIASALAWLLDTLVLAPLGATHLQLMAYVAAVILASLLVGALAAKAFPALKGALGDGAAAIAANCAVLGIALVNAQEGYGFTDAVLNGLFGGLGFALALVLMAGVRERLEFSKIPEPMKGLPISLVAASLAALAFMGFAGMA